MTPPELYEHLHRKLSPIANTLTMERWTELDGLLDELATELADGPDKISTDAERYIYGEGMGWNLVIQR